MRIETPTLRDAARQTMERFGKLLDARSPVTERRRLRVIRSMYHEGARFRPWVWRFATLMALSVLLASLGLVADSPAVIIGAMVVAPLMGPVLGVSAAVVMGWPRRGVQQAVVVLVAAAGAITLAALLSIPLGTFEAPSSELLARTKPNIRDLVVAMVAGTVGAYTMVRREAAEAMAGAAIAVALVPPLATVGISLSAGRIDMAVGGLMLVLANVAGVMFAGAITFIFVGFVPGMSLAEGAGQIVRGLRWVALAVVLMVVPLQWAGPGLLSPPPEGSDVEQIVEDWSADATRPADVIEVGVAVEGGVANVDVVVASSGRLPSVEMLADSLSQELGREVIVELQQVESSTQRASVGG
ncbi:MAG: DUF389 domain-containing protein [Actinomycetota bacterium]|nr:DUF389 domain-containing protein [Actinomycetota bacterium]